MDTRARSDLLKQMRTELAEIMVAQATAAAAHQNWPKGSVARELQLRGAIAQLLEAAHILESVAECEHKWMAYSHPPLRAVAGRKCTSCGLDEPADVDDDEIEVELREGETDLQCAERVADELEAAKYEWGADFQTLLFVAVREVRRQREMFDNAGRCSVHGCRFFGEDARGKLCWSCCERERYERQDKQMREENARLKAPRYSTEAVDALLTAADASFDNHLFAGCECGRALKTAVEAVRASREPKL